MRAQPRAVDVDDLLQATNAEISDEKWEEISERVEKFNAALNDGIMSAEIQQLLANVGLEAKRNTPEEFAAYIAIQRQRWAEVGKAAGVTIN